ncbi:MAG: TolC family protein, partial [Bdellovibrionales bacterium]|nr:TolC family protein [Bdellovibrionales bacterium]
MKIFLGVSEIKYAVWLFVLFYQAAAFSQQSSQWGELTHRFLADSPAWAAAQAKYNAEKEEAKKALTHFIPSVELQLGMQDKEYSALFGGYSSLFPSTTYSAAFTAKQTLFAGGRIWKGYELKQVSAEYEKHNLKVSKNNLVSGFLRKVFAYLSARDTLQVLQASAKTQRQYVEVTTKKQKRGAALDFELSQAQADEVSYESRLIEAKRGLESALRNLNSELPSATSAELDLLKWPKVHQRPPETLAVWLTRATQNQPDYLAARTQLEMAELNESMTMGEHWPSVQVSASLGYESGQTDTLFDESSQTKTVTVGLQVPLFSGLSSLNDRRASGERVFAAKKAVEQSRRTLDVNLQDAYDAVVRSQSVLDKAKEAARLSTLAYDQAFASFQTGRVRSQ